MFKKNDEQPEELTTLAKNFEFINILFKEHGTQLSVDKLRTILKKDPTFNGLYHILDEDGEPLNPYVDSLIDDALENDLEKPLTMTSFFDAFIDGWFEQKSVSLMMEGRLPKDGHSVMDDFINFTGTLASAMYLAGLHEVSPANNEIWQQFFNPMGDENLVRGREASPLIKKGSTYSFAHEVMIQYFTALKDCRDFHELCEETSQLQFGK